MVASPTTKVATGKVATIRVTTTTVVIKVGMALALQEIFIRKRVPTSKVVASTRATISSTEVTPSSSRSAPITTTTTSVGTAGPTKISKARLDFLTNLRLISAGKLVSIQNNSISK